MAHTRPGEALIRAWRQRAGTDEWPSTIETKTHVQVPAAPEVGQAASLTARRSPPSAPRENHAGSKGSAVSLIFQQPIALQANEIQGRAQALHLRGAQPGQVGIRLIGA